MRTAIVGSIREGIRQSIVGDGSASSQFTLTGPSLVPQYGGSTPSYARNSIASGIDFQGKLFEAKANEARLEGNRRVENLIVASEDMTNGAWSSGNGATVDSATQVTFDGTTDGFVAQTITIEDDGSGDGGRTFVLTAEAYLVSGTVTTDSDIALRIAGAAVNNQDQNIGNAMSGSFQRFRCSTTIDAAGTSFDVALNVDIAATIVVTKWQLEEVTGNLSHQPSEYVSTGAGTGPEIWTNPPDTVEGQWTDNGDGTYTANTTPARNLIMSGDAVSGKDYVFEFTITDYVSGAFKVLAGTVASGNYTSNGTYRHTLTSNGADLTLQAGTSSQFTVSAISIKEADHGANRDGVKYFTTHNGNTPELDGSGNPTGVVTAGTGALINASTSKFVEMTADTMSVSTPHTAAQEVSDFTVTWAGALDSYSTFTYLASDWVSSTDNRAWTFFMQADGDLGCNITDDGSDGGTSFANGSHPVPFSDGEFGRMRMSIDQTAGTATFFISYDPPGASNITWVQLGEVVDVSTETPMATPSADFQVGSVNAATSSGVIGKIHECKLYDSTDPATGNVVVDFNPNNWDAGVTWESSLDEVWTLNGNAVVFGPKSQWVNLGGAVNDGASTPDSAVASITSDVTMLWYGALADWTPASQVTLMGKWLNTGSNRSYVMQYTTLGEVQVYVSADGSGNVNAISDPLGFSDGTPHWIRASVDISADTLSVYVSDDSPWTPYNQINWVPVSEGVALSSTIASIFDSNASVEVGSQNSGISRNIDGKVMRAAVIASTDPTAAPAVDFDARAFVPGVSTAVTPTGETWTLNGNAATEGGNFPVSKWDADGPYGYLAEGARTNILLHSNDITDAAHSQNGAAAVANAGTFVDGSLTMQRLDVTAGSSTHNTFQSSVTISTATDYTFSAFVKDDGGRYLQLRANLASNDYAAVVFDLQEGLVGTTAVGSGSASLSDQGIDAVRDGIYRVWMTFQDSTNTTAAMAIEGSDSNAPTRSAGNGSITYTAVAGDDYLVGGQQMEQGSFPSTYIPTEGSSVTRNKDELEYSYTATYPLTMFAETVASQNSSAAVAISLDDDTANELIRIGHDANGNHFAFSVDGGATVVNNNTGLVAKVGSVESLAFAFDTSNSEFYLDGRSEFTDGSATFPTTTKLKVGQQHDGSNQPYGNIRNVKIFNKRLTDAEVSRL